jgi:NO-binding membrane sensor protein with MHYT domain
MRSSFKGLPWWAAVKRLRSGVSGAGVWMTHVVAFLAGRGTVAPLRLSGFSAGAS